jgi:SpoVK/Ycf46/Vps4 family AAA+-type ATPase
MIKGLPVGRAMPKNSLHAKELPAKTAAPAAAPAPQPAQKKPKAAALPPTRARPDTKAAARTKAANEGGEAEEEEEALPLEDIAGCDEIVAALRELVVLPITHPEFFEGAGSAGSGAPTGVLLYGASGVGKTMLARGAEP